MCSQIMRDSGRETGCVVRDGETYLARYKAGREGKPAVEMKEIKAHI